MKRMRRMCEECDKRVSPRALERGRAKEIKGKFWHNKCMGQEQYDELIKLTEASKVSTNFIIAEHRLVSCHNGLKVLLQHERQNKHVDRKSVEKIIKLLKDAIDKMREE